MADSQGEATNGEQMLAHLQATFTKDVTRKIRLAAQVHTADDREIVLTEAFNDICGAIDEETQELLGHPGHQYFHEEIALAYTQDPAAARELLSVCWPLWSSEYIPPILALVLHGYVLQLPNEHDKLKTLMNVLVDGAAALFWIDVSSNVMKFCGLHAGLRKSVETRLEHLKSQSNNKKFPLRLLAKLVTLIASYMPYYVPREQVVKELSTLPPLTLLTPDTSSYPYDYVIEAFCVRLQMIPAQKGLARYLDGLVDIVRNMRQSCMASELAKSRLENQLYFLTMPGGPKYCPRDIRDMANHCMQLLAPKGNILRSLVRYAVRLCFPRDWPFLAVTTYRYWLQCARSARESARHAPRQLAEAAMSLPARCTRAAAQAWDYTVQRLHRPREQARHQHRQ